MTVPFHDNAELEQFCTPFIRGEQMPSTAAELMASRYVAYTLAEIDYILETHHPTKRDDADRDSTKQWAESAEWLGLEIVDTVAGGPDDDTGIVEFIARYAVNGQQAAHHERSEFRKVDGRWYFYDGEMVKPKPVVREAPKVGRNEPCPCGSGKKFKKCHGAAA